MVLIELGVVRRGTHNAALPIAANRFVLSYGLTVQMQASPRCTIDLIHIVMFTISIHATNSSWLIVTGSSVTYNRDLLVWRGTHTLFLTR